MKGVRISLSIILSLLFFTISCSDSEEDSNNPVIPGNPCEGVKAPSTAEVPLLVSSDSSMIKEKAVYGTDGTTVCCTVPYKDLDGDSEMDAFEDWSLSPEERAAALVADSGFTAEMKAGLLVNVDILTHDAAGDISAEESAAVTAGARMFRTSANEVSARGRGKFANNLQAAAESGAYSIPVLLSSDILPSYPNSAWGMSYFPGMPGVGSATYNNLELAEGIGSDLAQDLKAIGVRLMFGPQADLATEPRWWGTRNLLGEDASKVGTQVSAMVKGIQGGDSLSAAGVAAVVNYFPGAGPQKNGLDSRDPASTHLIAYGSSDNLDYHIAPFEDAISAGVTGIMAAHGAPEGAGVDEVSVSYNADLLTARLKGTMGFDGLIFSDTDALDVSTAVGVSASTTAEKVSAMFSAGCDVITGVSSSDASNVITAAASYSDAGKVDTVAEKVLTLMFRLGLFENPYIVNEDGEIDGTVAREKAGSGVNGVEAMSEQVVLLKNTEKTGAKAFLPMEPSYLYGVPGTNFYWIDDSELFEYEEAMVNASGYSFDKTQRQICGLYDSAENTYSEMTDQLGYDSMDCDLTRHVAFSDYIVAHMINYDSSTHGELQGEGEVYEKYYIDDNGSEVHEGDYIDTNGNLIEYVEGETEVDNRIYTGRLTTARKLYSQYIVHFIDAPRKSADDEGTSDPDGLLSYYYNLDGTGDAADNVSVIDAVKENSELVSGWENTIYIVVINMERPSYVLDEIYNLADCVVLHWGSSTKYLMDVLHNVDNRNTDGTLTAGLPASNAEVEGGDSALPSAESPDLWRNRGYSKQLVPLDERE